MEYSVNQPFIEILLFQDERDCQRHKSRRAVLVSEEFDERFEDEEIRKYQRKRRRRKKKKQRIVSRSENTIFSELSTSSPALNNIQHDQREVSEPPQQSSFNTLPRTASLIQTFSSTTASSLPRSSRTQRPVFTPTGYVSPAASLKKKTKVDLIREKYKENVKEFDKVTGGILQLSNSNSLFNEIFNTNK